MAAPAPAPRVDVRILGPLELSVDGIRIATGGPQARVVLARLLVDVGRVVSVDRLEEALWDEEPPASAAVTLRAYVSRLRSSLAGAAPEARLRTVAPGYLLEVNRDVLDAARFEHGVDVGRGLLEHGELPGAAAAFEAALAEWRGEVLPELAGRPFLEPLAARLDGLRLTALEDLFEARLALGAHDAILPQVERHAEEQPTRERAWDLRMRALYQAGRQADALAAYARIRRLLAHELGVDPGPAIEETQRRILCHELDTPRRPAPASDGAASLESPARPGSLPSHRDAFIGRARELDRIAASVAPGGLVTLVGVAGVGKTRLAVEAARRMFGRPASGHPGDPSAVVFVDLSSVPPNASPGSVATTIATAAGITLRSADGVIDELTAALAPAGLLVVLDNCEHVLDPVAIIVGRLCGAAGPAGVRLLATSRAPVHLPCETVVSVEPLGTEAADDDAVALLADRLLRATGTPPEDAAAMAELCRRLDGLPLAIELAAAQGRSFTVREIERRLADPPELLRARSRVAQPRHATLRAALDWSHELLDASPRDVFAALGVFRGTFAIDDAAAVVSAAGIATRSATEEAVAHLLDASLVTRTGSDAVDGLAMLEVVRAYAAERLMASGREAAVREAHARRVLEVADALRRTRDTPAEGAAFDRLERMIPDVRVALGWSLRERPSLVGPGLVAAMGDTWRIRGYLEEGIRETTQALAHLDQPGGDEAVIPIDLRARLLAQLGMLFARATDLPRARELLVEADAVAAAAGDRRLRGSCLHALAFVQRTRGAIADAKATLAIAIPLRRETGDLGGLAWSIGNLADIAVLEGDYELADRLYADGGLVVAAAGDPPGLSVAYAESRSRLALLRDDPRTALVLADRALDAARLLGDRWHVGLSHAVLAAARRRLGDPQAAGRDALEAFHVFSRLGEQRGRAESAELLAGALLDRGASREASALFAAASAARRAAGVPLEPAREANVETDRRRARDSLGEQADDAAREIGAALPLEAAVGAAIA